MDNFTFRKRRISAALGKVEADFVMKNAVVFNVFTKEYETGDIAVIDGYIVGIGSYHGKKEMDAKGRTVVPGFIDGHLHLESSVVTPKQYARAVLPHGTTAIVADPHEIANVLGEKGIDYILNSTATIPLDVFIMMPSCVPATPFDESGAFLNAEIIDKYLENERILGLAELMNYPGVLGGDDEVIRKIRATMRHRKMIDGHAPGLSGEELNAYTTAGVFSDHECTTAEEAIDKLKHGQWIMIREGTACKNLLKLLPLFEEPYARRCLLVTDDKHPGDLKREGHIDHIVRKAIANGADKENAYCMASINAATYFGMRQRGAVCPGYIADFILLDDMDTVQIAQVYKNGILVADCKTDEKGQQLIDENHKLWLGDQVDKELEEAVMDTIKVGDVTAADFVIHKEKEKIIGLIPGEILTTDEGETSQIDVSKDICKMAVVERHHMTGHIGVAFVKGYGLQEGAIATSIAHDSHNIIVAGASEEDMAVAIQALKEMHGGMVVVNHKKVVEKLALPIAGLMCNLDVEETQEKMDAVKEAARAQGVREDIDPFMTLSFTSLAVIPALRLTTLGVVDVNQFKLL